MGVIRKGLIAFFAVGFAVVVGSAVFFASPKGERLIRDVIVSQLETATGLTIGIDSFETNIVSSASVHGLHVVYTDSSGTTEILSCEKARVSYRLWRIIPPKPLIDSLHVSGFALSLEKDGSGLRLPRSAEKKEEAPPNPRPLDFGVRFGRLVLENSSASYADTIIPLSLSTGDAAIVVSAASDSSYALSASFGSWDVTMLGKTVDAGKLTVDAILTSSAITVGSVGLDAAGLRAEGAGSIDFSGGDAALMGNVRVTGNLLPLTAFFANSIPPRFMPKEAGIAADITLTGTANDPMFSLKAEIPVLTTDACEARDILTVGSYRGGAVTIDTLAVAIFSGKITGGGNVSADTLAAHSLSLTVEGVRFERLWTLVYGEQSPYRGVVDGTFETEGALLDPASLSGAARLSLHDITFRSRPLAAFEAGVVYRDSLLTVELKQNEASFNAAVKIDGTSMSGTFGLTTSQVGELAGFARLYDLSGALDVTGVVGGTMKEPVVDAAFKGEAIRFHGFPVDSIKGGVSYKNGHAFLSECFFAGSFATVDSLTAPFRVDGLSGSLSYEGTLSGDVLDPSGELHLSSKKPSFGTYRCDSIEASFAFAGKSIEIVRAALTKDALAMIVSGGYSIPDAAGNLTLAFNRPDGTEDASASFENGAAVPGGNSGNIHCVFDLKKHENMVIAAAGKSLDIAAIAPAFADSLDIGGRLDFAADFTGSLKKPSGQFALSIDKPRYSTVAVDSLKGDFHLTHEKFECTDLSLFYQGQQTWAAGSVGFFAGESSPVITGASPIDATAEGIDFLARLVPLALPETSVFSGSSAYRLTCGGTVAQPEINGEVRFSAVDLALKPGSLGFHNVSCNAVFMDSVLVVDSIAGFIETAPFELRGRVATADWTVFHAESSLKLSGKDIMTLEGDFGTESFDSVFKLHGLDCSLLKIAAPVPDDLKGTAFATVAIGGDYARPALEGVLTLSDVSFHEPDLNVALRQGKATVRFDKETVSLDSLTAVFNNGWLRGKGRMTYGPDGVIALDVTTEADKLKFEKRRQYSINVKNTRLTCKKVENFYDIDGDITLDESRITADFQAKSLLPFLQKAERPAQARLPVMRQIRLSVRTHGGDKLWIDNNLARLRVLSEMEVIGTAARPNVAGRFTVEEGYVLYLDRKFKVNRAVLDFIDPVRLNPLVDFQAETSVKSAQRMASTPYTITLSMNGPLDKATVDLVSEPALDKSDIITLLTVGATRDQLTARDAMTGDAMMGDILKQRAEMLSSRQLSSMFTRRVGGALGLEEISVEGNLFDIGKTAGPQLIASEKISDRVEVTFTTTVGHVNDQSVRLDYKLNRFFSVEGQTDQNGRAGLDLKYRLRFK